MAIVLTALKLIGILLAVIVSVIIIVTAAVLIMPLGYEFSGEKYEKIKATAAVRWLMGIVKADVCYADSKAEYSVKLFGKTVYPKAEKETVVKERGGSESAKEKNEAEKAATPKPEPVKKDTIKPQQPKKATVSDTVSVKKDNDKKISAKAAPMAKKDIKPKVVRVKMPEVSEFPEEEKEPEKMTLKDFIIGYIKDMPSEEKKNAVAAVISLVKGVIKHILPQDISVYAVIGTDDPSVTGYILAVAGIMRGFTGKDILVQGDFEKKRAEGEAFVKGQIRLGVLLYMAIRLLLTKPVRKFIIRFVKVRGELV